MLGALLGAGVAKAVGGSTISSAVAGGLASAFGSHILGKKSAKQDFRRQAHFAEDQSAKQMAFQREMSNTAYQRTMEDMRKAGLNPILASKIGGASTPAGAMASTPKLDTGARILQFAQIQQQVSTAQRLMLENQMLEMDLKGLKKAGMFPMLLRHTPFNYIGSKATQGFENLFTSLRDLVKQYSNPRNKEGNWEII